MRKRGEERRSEIVQAALRLLAERGPKEVTTQAIADRVGIAQATVFRHFRTRDEIFVHAIGWIGKQVLAIVDEAVAGRGAPDERLRRLVTRQLGLIASLPGLPRLLFSDRLHRESPRLKAAVRQVMAGYLERVGGLIREGQRAGVFSGGYEPEAGARLVAASVQGLLLRWSLHDFAFDLRGEAEELCAFLLAALRHAEIAQPGGGHR
ncbi:MAG TPA: TetR/AcrR family transcriptional regulator [Chromatiales bacterium]|nr:TetR/AcrR family transcriptional regulator [Chromatiales bacterium]